MNTGVISCIIFGGLFLVMTILFTLLKEKAAVLISGFNSIPKEERKNYNQQKMSKDMRNSFILWSIIFFVGALMSFLVSTYVAIISFVVWLILFFKDVHVDMEKAFGKYRL